MITHADVMLSCNRGSYANEPRTSESHVTYMLAFFSMSDPRGGRFYHKLWRILSFWDAQNTYKLHAIRGRPTLKDVERFRNGSVRELKAKCQKKAKDTRKITRILKETRKTLKRTQTKLELLH